VLAERGAEFMVIAAAWPLARLEHWRLLLRARALENQAFVVAVNAAGRQGDTAVAGHSTVVDPWGQVLVEADAAPQTLGLDLDPSLAAQARRTFPALADRRPASALGVLSLS
jgi:predicted amidohydrolase